jgi:hypothetical protein
LRARGAFGSRSRVLRDYAMRVGAAGARCAPKYKRLDSAAVCVDRSRRTGALHLHTAVVILLPDRSVDSA